MPSATGNPACELGDRAPGGYWLITCVSTAESLISGHANEIAVQDVVPDLKGHMVGAEPPEGPPPRYSPLPAEEHHDRELHGTRVRDRHFPPEIVRTEVIF